VKAIKLNNKIIFLKADAYWIAPNSEIIPVVTNHIGKVIETPEKFGLTMEEIMNFYQAEGEPLGLEGNARKKIILSLIGRGWIRIRYYPRKGWTINLFEFSQKEKSILHSWAAEMVSLGLSIHDSVNLDLPGEVITYHLQNLIQDI